jgi:predicted nucleic acid-binding protein
VRGLFIDTSGFYALANPTDAYHVDAARAFGAIRALGLPLYTSNFVLAETHALFIARDHAAAALAFVERTLASNIRIERVTAHDESATLEILRRYRDKDFSFTDASSFVLMRKHGVDIALSSDHHFIQFGFQQARG